MRAKNLQIPVDDTFADVPALSNGVPRLPTDAGDFWYIHHPAKGAPSLKISQVKLVDFLESNGFAKYYPHGAAESILIRIQNQIVERVSGEQVKDFTLSHVDSMPEDLGDDFTREDLRAALAKGANVYFSQYLLTCIRPAKLQFQRDSQKTAYRYFRNCFVRIEVSGDSSEIAVCDYEKLAGHIWREWIIDRDFRPDYLADDEIERCEFLEFLCNVGGGAGEPDAPNPRLQALVSALGYLIHRYKNRAMSKAICLVDQRISDTAEGRSGKSIYGDALRHCVPAVRIDARNFRFDSQFAFQSVDLDTAVIDFNDCGPKFPFERLFSVITDDMQVEQKNQNRMNIPFEESPKFLLTTNYVLDGEGSSHVDRIFEIELSDHYSLNHKPVDDFGHLLFYDWDADEWGRFDAFVNYCLEFFLKYGLVSYQHKNLNERKARQRTCAEFVTFANESIEPGTEYDKAVLYNQFAAEYPELEIAQRTFTTWLKAYARVYGWGVREDRISRTTDGSEIQVRTITLGGPDACLA